MAEFFVVRLRFVERFFLCFALGALGPNIAQAADGQQNSCAQISRETCDLAKSLRRGVNFGNMLEAPREGDWGVRVEPQLIELAAANFSTVRVPIRWSNHAAVTADATLDDFFAKRVDNVVDALLAKGLNVIINVHHYSQLAGGNPGQNEFPVDPSVVDVRYINIWKQVAERYKNRSPKLIFELLNEPSGRLDGDVWNKLLVQALEAVRRVNPVRAVLIGPSYWNNVRDLPKLKIPADKNIIVAFHTYDPLGFTHQGVRWITMALPVGTMCCDTAQKNQIISTMDAAKKWSEANGYPLHLGEFGTVNDAPMAARVDYARFVRDQAEARGFGWTYWELASTFGIFNAKSAQWVEPLRKALLD